jgi:photosystem II stability/assembly factor-like uncharacterized protein
VLWYGKAPPGWGGVVTRMKQVVPGVGWAERAGRLYWTSDDGANWRDITPPEDGTLGSIFFLDTSKGWIRNDHYQKSSGELQLYLATTADTGATWSRIMVRLRPKDYGVPGDAAVGGGAGSVAFADPLHGWMNVRFGGETPNSWSSSLLLTSDGGRTWNRAADAPELEQAEVLAVTPSEGWLFGVDHDTNRRLYVTRDGARSWQEVAPEPPGLAYSQIHGLPTFEDAERGFLQVNGVGRGDPKYLTMVLLATSDGGRTWKPDRTISNLDDATRDQYGASMIVGSDWIFAASSEHGPVLTKLGPGATIDATANAAAPRPRYGGVDDVSFATPTQGWVIVGDGDLMSTTDGGATWTALTPGPQPHEIQPHGSFVPRQSMRSSTAAAPSADPPSANGSSGRNVSPR